MSSVPVEVVELTEVLSSSTPKVKVTLGENDDTLEIVDFYHHPSRFIQVL